MKLRHAKSLELGGRAMRFGMAPRPHSASVAPRHTAAAIVLLCTPATALAHGIQIVGMPVGNLVALVAVVAATLALKVGWKARLAALLLALAVALPPYFLPNSCLPWELTSSEWGNFFIGVVPPLVAAALFLAWRRRAAARR
jgi:hypothetical protein